MPTYFAGKRLERLKNALPQKFAGLRKLRTSRARFLTAAAGALYPIKLHPDHDVLKDILNLLRQAEISYTLGLSGERPQFLATSKRADPKRDSFADHYAQALNAYSATMHLEEVLQECVRNAFYSLGIAKVYMADSEPVLLEADEWMDPGKPFVSSLSISHFCFDTDATHFRHCDFLADRYCVRLEDVISDTRYPSKLRKKIEMKARVTPGARREQEWALRSAEGGDHEIDPKMYLSDIFMPKEGLIGTFAVNDRFEIVVDEPLAESEYEASETGPYRFLSFGQMADSTIPSAPAQHLFLCHNLINSLYRKLQDGAMSLKELFVGSSGDKDDINEVKNADNLDYLALQAPDVVKALRLGGPDQNVFAFTLNAIEQFDKLAGNMQFKLGVGANADTATQQGMIGQNLGRLEADTQRQYVCFVRQVGKELGRLLFTDNSVSIPMNREIYPGNSVYAPWQPAIEQGSRHGEFVDYDLDIVPYDHKYKGPEQRVAELDQQFQMVAPIMPLLMQQGKAYDVARHFEDRAQLLNNAHCKRLFVDIPPPEGQAQQPGGGGGQLGPREYLHHSQSSGQQSSSPDPLSMMQAATANNQN